MQSILPRLLLAGSLLTMAPTAYGQDVLMANGNTQITVSASPMNFYQNGMQSKMKDLRYEASGLTRFDYTLNFSKPLSFTAEYAVTSYTTVGANVNYFSYDLSELREDAMGITTANTKGSHLDLHARAVRYFYANPNTSMYLLGEIGISKRSIQYTGSSTDAAAYINTFPETRKDGYEMLSYDYGVGFRFRVFGGVGISAEYTMLSLLGRYGLFYIIKPAGRRSKDQIGW
jgi:hypothetical protein